MKTPIADMISEMNSTGIPVETIICAVRKLELAMAERTAISTGNTVEAKAIQTILKRRAWDRERKKRIKSGGIPPENNSTGIPPEMSAGPNKQGNFHRNSTGIPPETQPNRPVYKEGSKSIQEEVKEKKESKTHRGSRIPPEFAPDEATLELAESLGIARGDVASQILPEFRDYWISVPGARGVKLNWNAVFRNRLRDIAKYRGRHGRTDNARANSVAGRATAREAHHIAAVGGAALRYLAEGNAAGQRGEIPGSAGPASLLDLTRRAKSVG